MALALGRLLVSAGTASNLTVYTTATLTNAPGAGRLILGFIELDSTAATVPTVSTVTGGGLTTVAVHATSIPWTSVASPTRRVSLVYAQQTGAGATTAFTITASGACIGASWMFFELDGAFQDFAGNGAGAILQVVSSTDTSATSLTSPTGGADLAAASHPDNRPVAGVSHGANETTTIRANWTQTDTPVSHSGPSWALAAQWRSDVFETVYGSSWATLGSCAALAAEVRAAPDVGKWIPHPRLSTVGPVLAPAM